VTAALALTVATSGLALDLGGPSRGLPAASAEQLQGWAVASGSSVQLGNGHTVQVDGQIKSIYYTSAGVLVRSGINAYTDAAKSTYNLVTDDGDVTSFALDLPDRVPGTDPKQPYLAYAEATNEPDRWNVVLRDVRTGEVKTRIPVTGAFTWGGWQAPPVSLSGDHVYVGMDEAMMDVNWRTEAVTASKVLPKATMPEVVDGRMVVTNDPKTLSDFSVIDAQTGEQLLHVREPVNASKLGERLLHLSSDGRHALGLPWSSCTEGGDKCDWELPTAFIYDIASGDRDEINIDQTQLGWTPNGDLLKVDGTSVEVCGPQADQCRPTPVKIDGRTWRLGGTNYES
jgi:hypothetical protein